ncbi:MAG TPA: hypothetical protein PLX89_24215, partial [Verrucomicrobiota bacterium]|nr:hypothetical protein [Verrucomicrobiota bacterium]
MRASPASTYFLLLLLLLATADSTQGQWTDKVTDTPSLIQTDFGPYGKYLPGNGESFCAPTSATMSLYWLARNGFTQLASTNLADAANLDRVLGGLMGTTPAGGTDENGYYNGFMTYLSARGISPAQVTRVFTPNPDVHWLATNNFNQSVVNFSVGWYYASPSGQTTNYINNGGHVLTLLAANPAAQIVTINNAYPASFFPVPNVPSSNPQTVTLASVPTSWTLQYLDTSIGYTQVITPDLGPATGGLAVLWGADSWTLNINALPAKPAYIARTWILSGLQQINTDEGHLEVIAPIAGSGGLTKLGEGTLRLLKKNSSTGDYRATDGVLATQAPVDTPFGSGSMHINGDAMVLIKPDDVTPAEVSMQIASGDQRYLGISLGAGKLMFDRGTNHSLSVTIGGNTNGTGSNLLIDHPAALVVVPRHGLAELGNTEQLIVNGHDHNLPEVSNGMVTPALAAANNDPNGSLAFLTYDATKGFLPAELISSAALNINESTSSTKYSVDTPQSVDANSTAEVAALAVN